MPKNEVPGTDGLLHPRCDCLTKEISFSLVKFKASSQCDIGKFTNYIFKDNGKDKGKKQIFKVLNLDRALRSSATKKTI